jgi:hypothetical protein
MTRATGASSPATPTTTERGYGYPHQLERKRWAQVVSRGEAYCARCGRWIFPDDPWDLAHNPYDPETYLGPMHRAHNRDTRLEKRLRKPRPYRAPVEAQI